MKYLNYPIQEKRIKSTPLLSILILMGCSFVMGSCNSKGVQSKSMDNKDAPSKITSQPIQDKANADSIDIEKAVSEIRAEFQRINSVKLHTETFKWELDGCANDGVVNYFLDKGSIVKVVESGFMGDGGWVNEYYYNNGKFIFSYEVSIGGPVAGPDTKVESRTYANNDKTIRFLESEHILKEDNKKGALITSQNTIQADRKAFNELSKEYKLLKAYQTKDFIAALCN